jgi:hypothetical protein
MFVAHCKRLEPLRAEVLLDAAQAATSVHAPKEWWENLTSTARGGKQSKAATTSSGDGGDGFFRVNGQPIELGEFKQKLAEGLGGGFVTAGVAA